MEYKTLAEKQQDILLSTALTGGDWEKVFASLSSGEIPDWLQVEEDGSDMVHVEREKQQLPQVVINLMSPMASDSKGGIFAVLPTLSFESDSSVMSNGDQNLLDLHSENEINGRLQKIESKILKIKRAWPKPFADLEASYLGVVAGIKTLQAFANSIKTALGFEGWEVQHPGETMSAQILHLLAVTQKCEASLQVLSTDLDAALQAEKFLVDQKISDIQNLCDSLGLTLSGHAKRLDVHESRFSHIKPALTTLMRGDLPGQPNQRTSTILMEIQTRLQRLESKDSLLTSSSAKYSTDLQAQVNLLEATIRDQASMISLLENRVVGAGARMGDLVFQSFEDLLAWVKVKLPSGRFGFIVDGHSFLEFFTLSGHVDSELAAAAEHNAEKAGYATYYEMKVAASFNNLFPLIFGKAGAGGLDDSDILPGVTTGEKWNNGSTGLQHQIMCKMNEDSYQLDTNIKQVYRNHPEARQQAIDCVTASKRFVIDFIAFISQEYSTWQTRGFSKKEAWRVVCQIVRRVFEDLESARVSAHHVRDKGNMDYISAGIIFATLKCHDIMTQYVQHQFHEHPAVSSVITRHLAANFVKPEQGQDTKISKLEAKVNACMTKLDSLESKLHASKQKN